MTEIIIIIGIIVGAVALMKNIGKETKKLPIVSVEDVDVKAPGIQNLDELYIFYGAQQGVSSVLLKAIAQVESDENPNAVNPRDPSMGLMQLLCVPDGAGSCSNKLNVVGWPPSDKEKLFDPTYSLFIAAQILRWNIDQYGFTKGIAVYNSWGAHTDPTGGPFRNQAYVDKVLLKYYALVGSDVANGSSNSRVFT